MGITPGQPGNQKWALNSSSDCVNQRKYVQTEWNLQKVNSMVKWIRVSEHDRKLTFSKSPEGEFSFSIYANFPSKFQNYLFSNLISKTCGNFTFITKGLYVWGYFCFTTYITVFLSHSSCWNEKHEWSLDTIYWGQSSMTSSKWQPRSVEIEDKR